ncbi:Rab11 family-interacting protein 2 [Tupaia chinensis]|uniref:Rab11 family-interacting protein 2 n=1 Tax=Tupaia chinensis TaxID=246437 RepID=L9KPI1_TUPCH|nr:Rab11 family-interacting protein 2 [Tupaia chinensis]
MNLTSNEDLRKVPDSNPFGATVGYRSLIYEEVLRELVKHKELLRRKDTHIRELKDYIDNLLVRVMEETPSILRVPYEPSRRAANSPVVNKTEGLSEKPEVQSTTGGLLLSLYLVAIIGNLLILLATISHSHLHTPMYFFLSNLSFSVICFTSTTVSKMLVNIQTQNKVITYAGCIT